MPQLDLKTQVTGPTVGGHDTRVACRTQADSGAVDDPPKNDVVPDEYESAEVPPDFPPESFWLSKDAEYDWFDRNALFERKESTKGISSSINSNPHPINPALNASSQRFSANLKSKASIIGLPKTQKTTFVDAKRRTCRTANARLFPRRTGSVRKSNAPVVEPGSPKVSCMGRVRSRGGRRRSNSLKRAEKIPVTADGSEKQERVGFCSVVIGFFQCNRPARSGSRKVVEAVMEEQRKSVSVKVEEAPVSPEPVAEPPALGGMKRFVSGRRSGSWASDDLCQGVPGSWNGAMIEVERTMA